MLKESLFNKVDALLVAEHEVGQPWLQRGEEPPPGGQVGRLDHTVEHEEVYHYQGR